MNANELKIGNLFTSSASNNGKVFDINSIMVLENKECLINSGWPISYLQPIPLTEDWLIKFGFSDYPNNGKSLTLAIEEGGITWRRYNGVINIWGDQFEYNTEPLYLYKIKYVHELQNLYHALTGKELTIQTP